MYVTVPNPISSLHLHLPRLTSLSTWLTACPMRAFRTPALKLSHQTWVRYGLLRVGTLRRGLRRRSCVARIPARNRMFTRLLFSRSRCVANDSQCAQVSLTSISYCYSSSPDRFRSATSRSYRLQRPYWVVSVLHGQTTRPARITCGP